MTNEYEPDGFRIKKSALGDGRLKLEFYGEDGSSREIVLSMQHAAMVTAELMQHVSVGGVRPMGPAGQPMGTIFRLKGYDTRRRGEHGLLTLYIEVNDGIRTIPIEVTRPDAASMIEDFAKML